MLYFSNLITNLVVVLVVVLCFSCVQKPDPIVIKTENNHSYDDNSKNERIKQIQSFDIPTSELTKFINSIPITNAPLKSVGLNSFFQKTNTAILNQGQIPSCVAAALANGVKSKETCVNDYYIDFQNYYFEIRNHYNDHYNENITGLYTIHAADFAKKIGFDLLTNNNGNIRSASTKIKAIEYYKLFDLSDTSLIAKSNLINNIKNHLLLNRVILASFYTDNELLDADPIWDDLSIARRPKEGHAMLIYGWSVDHMYLQNSWGAIYSGSDKLKTSFSKILRNINACYALDFNPYCSIDEQIKPITTLPSPIITSQKLVFDFSKLNFSSYEASKVLSIQNSNNFDISINLSFTGGGGVFWTNTSNIFNLQNNSIHQLSIYFSGYDSSINYNGNLIISYLLDGEQVTEKISISRPASNLVVIPTTVNSPIIIQPTELNYKITLLNSCNNVYMVDNRCTSNNAYFVGNVVGVEDADYNHTNGILTITINKCKGGLFSNSGSLYLKEDNFNCNISSYTSGGTSKVFQFDIGKNSSNRIFQIVVQSSTTDNFYCGELRLNKNID